MGDWSYQTSQLLPALVLQSTDNPGRQLPAVAAETVHLHLLDLPQSAAYPATYTSPSIDTQLITYGGIDANFQAFTGGATPGITFFLERSSDNVNWYPLIASGIGPFTTAQVISGDFSPNISLSYSAPPTSFAQHVVFGHYLRFRWTTTGAPTAVTLVATIFGR